jgi:hypothetical protein
MSGELRLVRTVDGATVWHAQGPGVDFPWPPLIDDSGVFVGGDYGFWRLPPTIQQ